MGQLETSLTQENQSTRLPRQGYDHRPATCACPVKTMIPKGLGDLDDSFASRRSTTTLIGDSKEEWEELENRDDTDLERQFCVNTVKQASPEQRRIHTRQKQPAHWRQTNAGNSGTQMTEKFVTQSPHIARHCFGGYA